MLPLAVFLIGYVLTTHLAVALYGPLDLGWAAARYRRQIVRRIAVAAVIYLLAFWLCGPYRPVFLSATGIFLMIHVLNYCGIRAFIAWLRWRRAVK